ncbi:MAG: preprotein translocase subunit YajC [Clostridia bacterium]|nr:preprotein translocase subunit YajC [Clostridia bacterium]
MGMFLPVILIFVVFYFFLIRPEKKRKKEIDAMRNSLKVGDTVTTIGGIIGEIAYINNDDNIVAIRTGKDGVEIKFARWAIGTKETVEETSTTEDTNTESAGE